MRFFWMLLGWLAALWIAFFMQIESASLYVGFIACAIFFALYFLTPVLRHRPAFLFAVLCLSMLTIGCTLYILRDGMNGIAAIFVSLLLFSYFVGEAVYRLPAKLAIGYGMLAVISLPLLVSVVNEDKWVLLPYIGLYAAAFSSAAAWHRKGLADYRESRLRYDALLNEFRELKRTAKNAEEAARLEERTNIARQIHDSVGHKLTSLLLQLEMFRMDQGPAIADKAKQMKQLAQDSLDETRKAVKALNDQEPGGVPAIIRLIRNLETESYLQVEFSFRHGALSAVLPSEQSVAVYRAIQEALTNAMRHGGSRQVSVMLESPGGRVFRFEVINDTKGGPVSSVNEGFGLTAMRDRVERAGGELNIMHAGGKFIVRGTFKMGE